MTFGHAAKMARPMRILPSWFLKTNKARSHTSAIWHLRQGSVDAAERLQSRNLRSVERLLTHKRFRAGYDFLCLRAETDDALEVCAQWWTDFQTAMKMAENPHGPASQSNARRRSRRNENRGRKSTWPATVEGPESLLHSAYSAFAISLDQRNYCVHSSSFIS